MIKQFTISNFAKFIIFVSILPAVMLGSIGLPWYVVLSPLVFFVVCVKVKRVPYNFTIFFIIWLFVIIEILFTGLVQPFLKFSKISFSFDFILYSIKLLYFVFFFWLGYRKIVSVEKLLKFLIITLTIGMIIGVLQWINWHGSDFLSQLYTYNEKQFRLATRDDYFFLRRIPGIAHFATAQGGISAFLLLLSIGYFLTFKKDIKLIFISVVLGLINLIACGGRAGQLMLIVGILLYISINMSLKIDKKKMFYVLGILCVFIFSMYILFLKEVPVITRNVERFLYTISELSEDGGRVYKIGEALKLLQSPFDYLFGVSRYVQSQSGGVYIEVEFFNILILYGLLGLTLQYSLIILLAVYFYNLLKNPNKQIRNIAVCALVLLISYQFFSLGYFYFRETYVGQIPWIVSAYVLGFFENVRLEYRAKSE